MRKKILSITMAIAAAFIMTTSISVLAAADTTDPAEKTTAVTEKTEAATEEITEVTKEKALEIAVKHAGYTVEEAEDVIIEKGDEDDKPVYEVEFYVGVSKFDYDIEIATGKILDYEIDD